MAEIAVSGGGGGASYVAADTSFVLQGAAYFGPFYQPENFIYKKDRNLDREENACGGEDVADNGSKNRDIHVKGIMLGFEVESFNGAVDSNKPFQMLTPGWSGEVRIDVGEFEGPVGYDPILEDFQWEYTMDLVSTGVDEVTGPPDYGIIS